MATASAAPTVGQPAARMRRARSTSSPYQKTPSSRPPYLLERPATVGAACGAWPEEHRDFGASRRDGMASQPREPGKRDVHCQAEALDPLLARLEQQRRGGSEPLVGHERRGQPLEEVRPAIHIVVEKDDDIAVTRPNAPVASRREADVRTEFEHTHFRERITQTLGRSIGRAVVADDDRMRQRLRGQVLETALGQSHRSRTGTTTSTHPGITGHYGRTGSWSAGCAMLRVGSAGSPRIRTTPRQHTMHLPCAQVTRPASTGNPSGR